MVARGRAAGMNRGSGGEDWDKRTNAFSKLYGLRKNDSRQADLSPARDIYNLQQRLKNMRMDLDLGAARRGVDLGASYFDDY